MTEEADVVVALPERLRGELKEPMGPVFTDPAELLEHVVGRLIAIGDIVTYHFEGVGVSPDLAVVDGRTKREAVDEEVRAVLDTSARSSTVVNPPGTLSADLLAGLLEALDAPDATVLSVDGEEDLAVLPAILAAEVGASVVYGQPEEGMVHVEVTPETKAWVAALIERMDGDPGRLFSLVGYDRD